jgi:endonuclease VIII
VPEGDTIHRSAAMLGAALTGKRLVSFELRRSPRGRRPPEPGTTVVGVDAVGKHLLVHFDDGQVLHTHMQMTGAWHVYRHGERWRRPGHTARVVLEVECFAAPVAELRSDTRTLDRLGPDLCAEQPDLDAVMVRLSRLDPATELGVALLDQRVAAGIGNVYKSEVCWAERVSPFATVAALDAATRRRLFETAHRLLRANLGSARRVTFQGGLAVYGRVRRPCPRCRTPVLRRGGQVNEDRVTFWCPTCQPEPASPGAVERAP